MNSLKSLNEVPIFGEMLPIFGEIVPIYGEKVPIFGETLKKSPYASTGYNTIFR